MSRESRTDTPLVHLVDEVRREPTPAVDWDALEASLMSRVARESVARPRRITAFSPRWALAAAACVLGLGGLLLARHPEERPAPAVATHVERPAPVVRSNVDGDTLKVGAAVSADVDDVVVEHEGHVTWSLRRGSRAHVEAAGEVVQIALDEGVVSARVVKSPRPESFVVRVEGTRIAVHGTEFRVERLTSGVHVEVTEGVLGIGPVGGPSFELRAPGAAMLDLAGARADQKKALPAPQRHASGAPEPARPAVAVPAPAHQPIAVAPEASPPAAGRAEERGQPAPPAAPRSALPAGSEPVVSRASRSVQRCFAANTMAGGDLQVSVVTQMTLRVTNDGRVGDALFDPPIAPGVRGCVDREIGALRFPSSPDGFEAVRSLELSR